MAKKNTAGLLDGLTAVPDGLGLTKVGGVGTMRYKETKQMKGRIARALAKTTPKGKGKIAKRPAYKKDMKVTGIKQTTKAERSRIVHALAHATKRGKGKIVKRPAYRKYV